MKKEKGFSDKDLQISDSIKSVSSSPADLHQDRVSIQEIQSKLDDPEYIDRALWNIADQISFYFRAEWEDET